ncbi:MAG: coproporphyrinogen III oxidase, partial [Flavobacteriaceae bacterium]
EMGYVSVGHDLIYGLPKQSVSDIEDTIEKTKALRPDRIALYSYAHVPWKKGNGQRGFKDTDLPSPERKRRQYEVAKKRLLEAGYVEIGMDHFALPHDHLYRAAEVGTLHRNFMGYTASKTQLLIGLGASSIGDSWYGYAQNVKSVEEYQHLVDNGIMPIYRGHVLTQKDQVIRRHILNLMCRFETAWPNETLQFEELDRVLDRLGVMQSDGLIKIHERGLQIVRKGKPFVRNICMMFDAYLHGTASDKKQFSMTV